MSLKSPFATQVGRSAYSAVVYKEDDLIIAEDEVGTVIKEGSNAATIIQAAIDSCGNAGRVILADRFDTAAELTLPALAWTSFSSGITLQGYGNLTGLNYTPATGHAINMHGSAADVHCFHHKLENFLVTAPSTTGGGLKVGGGVSKTVFRYLNFYNIPNGKAIEIAYNASYGGNALRLYDVNSYNVKYGVYATGGPSLFISGGKISTFLYGGGGGGLEAIYYDVSGYTGDGWKQFHTVNLEILSPTDQRVMYVQGDKYFTSSHHDLYVDGARLTYLDNGRHAFLGCNIGKIDWSLGTQVTVDQASWRCILDAKDSMFGSAELQTPFRIDTSSPFVANSGAIKNVNDAAAAGGKCAQMDAQNEYIAIVYAMGDYRMNKYIGRGRYLVVAYAKDTNQITNDLKMYVQAQNGGVHYISERWFTLGSTYNAIPYSFMLDSNDLAGGVIIYLKKDKANANTISLDYLTIQQVGTDFHQSLSGGHQFVYFPDAGTLPTASVAYRGVIAFQGAGAGSADTFKMCMKAAADTYAWKTIVTG
jgi:hypothetical protein